MQRFLLFSLSMLIIQTTSIAQAFYFGADQSYVNEMEDCGAVYRNAVPYNTIYIVSQPHLVLHSPPTAHCPALR